MNKRKILFMINSLNGGGAEQILQTLLTNINHQKYDITLFSMHRENISKLNYPQNVNYKVVFDKYCGNNLILSFISGILLKIKGKLFQILPSNLFYRLYMHGTYDVEVAFIEGESTKIISGSSNRFSKKIAWVHIDLKQNPWTNFLYKNDEDEANHYKCFDKIICVSESVRHSFLEKYYKVSSNNVQVLYNPIDRDRILTLSNEITVSKDINKIRMIAVGRLVEQKGFDRLIQICSLLKKDGFDFELFILGNGEEFDKLNKMISLLDLDQVVFLKGYLSNPYAVMKTGDLLVCSSRSEGFSTVLAEGTVLGLPIISTDCAGVRELFGHFQCGIITPNDDNQLYYALHDVLMNPEQLQMFSQESFERGKLFALLKTITDIEKLLD